MMEQPLQQPLHIELTVDIADNNDDLVKLTRQVKPEWSQDKLVFKVFTEGITNQLIGVHNGTFDDMILFRIYGECTELFIDRINECRTMQFLHRHDAAMPVYCTFDNGICYGFIPGTVFDIDMMRDPYYSSLVAKEMARIHTLAVPASFYDPGQTGAGYFLQFHRLLKQVPQEYTDPSMNKRVSQECMSIAELTEAINTLEAIADDFHCPMVLCHHDVLIKNLVYCPKKQRVFTIDYEYASMSYAPIDIGNHFNEYAGVEDTDYSIYPSRDDQLLWLRTYLSAQNEFLGKPNCVVMEDEVEELYAQSNKMALVSHLVWGVWGLVQARYSSIDFDFIDYAIVRFNEYKRRKEEFLAL